MFGSYVVDGRKDRPARLTLGFDRGEINFYSCAIRYIERIWTGHDWRTDVMSDAWSSALALRKLRALPDTLVCDALLDQNVFAGVGNIIKNEYCSAFACTRYPRSARCRRPSCASSSDRRGDTAFNSFDGEGIRAGRSTGLRTPSGPVRAVRFLSSRRSSARHSAAASSASVARSDTAPRPRCSAHDPTTACPGCSDRDPPEPR